MTHIFSLLGGETRTLIVSSKSPWERNCTECSHSTTRCRVSPRTARRTRNQQGNKLVTAKLKVQDFRTAMMKKTN